MQRATPKITPHLPDNMRRGSAKDKPKDKQRTVIKTGRVKQTGRRNNRRRRNLEYTPSAPLRHRKQARGTCLTSTKKRTLARMGNRLSRITTRTGDQGCTGLADGSRLPKSAARIHALGDIDELNSAIGVLIAQLQDAPQQALLSTIQHRLFDLGGELAIPGREVINEQHIAALETAMDSYNQQLSPLKEFILPGGNPAAAWCHLLRTVCRRAERSLVDMQATDPVNPAALAYVNRLSDLLFVLARVLNGADGSGDVLWQPTPKPEPTAT